MSRTTNTANFHCFFFAFCLCSFRKLSECASVGVLLFIRVFHWNGSVFSFVCSCNAVVGIVVAIFLTSAQPIFNENIFLKMFRCVIAIFYSYDQLVLCNIISTRTQISFHMFSSTCFRRIRSERLSSQGKHLLSKKKKFSNTLTQVWPIARAQYFDQQTVRVHSTR